MLIWIIVLIIVALSMISGEFAKITEEFFMEHGLSVLLAALGILYWWYRTEKRKRR